MREFDFLPIRQDDERESATPRAHVGWAQSRTDMVYIEIGAYTQQRFVIVNTNNSLTCLDTNNGAINWTTGQLHNMSPEIKVTGDGTKVFLLFQTGLLRVWGTANKSHSYHLLF